MQLSYNEEQSMLQDQVRSLCIEQGDPETLRQLITDKSGWKIELWQTMADLGLQAAAIPEAYGGVGLGVKELCVIAEEIGRSVAPVPFFSSSCMATLAIISAASDDQKGRWLAELAAGSKIATLAAHVPLNTDVERMPRVAGGQLTGQVSPVPDAGISDWAIVVVNDDGEPALAYVDLSDGSIDLDELTGFDQLRNHAALSFNDTPCEVLSGARGEDVIFDLFCHYAVIESFEQVGGAESALHMARDYTLERHIFGRQLASYQAVKHKLADILAMVELTRSNSLYAASALESGREDRYRAAATARVGATAVYEKAATENLQLHGGIGFTWEANCHFHYRRARLLAQNLGGPEYWHKVLVDDLAQTGEEV